MNGTQSSFEEVLARDGQLVYTNRGDSMWPLIREGRDILVIEPVRDALKKYDIPLYKRDSGQYVLHRIIQVRENDYVTVGDNRWRREEGVRERHILGVLTAVVRDGRKKLSMQDPGYRLWVRIWYALYPLRYLILRGRALLRRIMKGKKPGEK